MKFIDSNDEKLTEELASLEEINVGTFIKKRKKTLGLIGNLLKDSRKSKDAKRSWKVNRHKYLRGLKKFHKSTQGKLFHRKMSRFLTDRSSMYDKEVGSYGKRNSEEFFEDLVAINSVKTHLFIESSYSIIPDFDEHLSFYLMFEHASELLTETIYNLENNYPLNTDHIDCMKDLCKESFNENID